MNRSILIVICDFLLVSLLVFSTVDINKATQEGTATTVAIPNIATNQPSRGSDLANVMRLSLEEERQRRDLLTGELNATRATAQRQQHELETRQQEEARLKQEQSQLQQEQAGLLEKYSAAQTNIQNLSGQLKNTSVQATISSEKLLAMQAELEKQREQAAALQKQLDELSLSNQAALTEKQRLANQLQVAEVEKRSAKEIAAAMQEQVKAERAEKAVLAAGVQALATNSTKLAQEIREYRPMAANTIFSEYVSNRVAASFVATRPGVMAGVFGGVSTKKRDAQTVLVTDGQNIFALSHVEDTPLEFWPGIDWDGLSGTLNRDLAQVSIRSLSFHKQDPRIVYMPVTAAEAKQLGGKIYKTSNDPYKFQDAVLVGTREDYYGECKFVIDTTTPDYVKLDRSFLKGLFGKFNPSRGDLVLSKQGELLGVMANNTYCLMFRGFTATATFQFGSDVRAQHTGSILTALQSIVMQMPSKLQ